MSNKTELMHTGVRVGHYDYRTPDEFWGGADEHYNRHTFDQELRDEINFHSPDWVYLSVLGVVYVREDKARYLEADGVDELIELLDSIIYLNLDLDDMLRRHEYRDETLQAAA